MIKLRKDIIKAVKICKQSKERDYKVLEPSL